MSEHVARPLTGDELEKARKFFIDKHPEVSIEGKNFVAYGAWLMIQGALGQMTPFGTLSDLEENRVSKPKEEHMRPGAFM